MNRTSWRFLVEAGATALLLQILLTNFNTRGSQRGDLFPVFAGITVAVVAMLVRAGREHQGRRSTGFDVLPGSRARMTTGRSPSKIDMDRADSTTNGASNLAVLGMIRAAWASTLRAHGSAIDVPPYLATFDATSPLVWLNYATPIVDADDAALAGSISAVRETFAARERVVRFEFLEALQPSLPAILERHGLKLHVRMPAMACTVSELSTAALPHRVERLSADASDEAIAAFIAVRDAAFGPMFDTPLGEQIAEQRREWALGTVRSVVVYRDEVPAGVATLIGAGDVAELVGVGTVPAHRGHGVARAASEALVHDHLLNAGSTAVWLSAGNDTARDVYRRIGFRFIGWQANWIDANWQP